MIRSFYDKDLEKFWLSKGVVHVKCVPSELRKATYQKLRELNNAQDTRDLRKTPSNHFEKLTSQHHFGYSSIRVNDQYRLIFLWKNNNVYEVEITNMIKSINMNRKQESIIIHPGEVLREDFLVPLKLGPEKLAENIKVDPQIIHDLIAEKRDLDKDLATRLALYFDMSTEFWLGIQHDYEQDCLADLRINLSKEITPLRVSK